MNAGGWPDAGGMCVQGRPRKFELTFKPRWGQADALEDSELAWLDKNGQKPSQVRIIKQ
jgi:hypothetical protein